MIDPVELTQKLIQCPSVTPDEGGAIEMLQGILEKTGFTCHRLKFGDIDNLYARIGGGAPNFCFAGHTDVVPVGDEKGWSFPPFGGEIRDGYVCGRGAQDMKSAIAAFVAAAASYLDSTQGQPRGSISLLITGDEEGPAVNGTRKVLEWLAQRGEKISHCLVGEPTNPEKLGEMMKIGRRGSLNATITVEGKQGHVAYPHLADNPVPKLVRLMAALDALKLDGGNDHFQPSNLEIVTIDVGNPATNVIPARASARANVRFNDNFTGESLTQLLRQTLDGVGVAYKMDVSISGESFLTAPNAFTRLVSKAVEEKTGLTPDPSTTGGTSDARFIARYCPVLEFGITGQTMHKVDERVRVEDIRRLSEIYGKILADYFQAPDMTPGQGTPQLRPVVSA